MKGIIKEARFNWKIHYRGSRVIVSGKVCVIFDGNIQEAILLATFLDKGGSQCGPGFLLDDI